MSPLPRDLLPGTLEMLILRTLTVQSMHGYGIAQHISKTSQEVLKIEKGSLYRRWSGWSARHR
jgi:DNA-binding PadR family transcriptional regulator